MSSLPEELYLDILLRLPVKSLQRCKCVCKSWYNLITDPSFVKSHLIFAQKNEPSIIITSYQEGKDVVCAMSYHSLRSSSPTKNLHGNCVEFDYPFKSEKVVCKLVGSCNGLVCLWLESNRNYAKGLFCVWNPATTEYKIIPNPPNKQFFAGDKTFVYDYMAENYMLVHIVHYAPLQMEVYTLGTNSWKSTQNNLYCYYGMGCKVVINGNFHLLVRNREHFSQTVLSLNMRNDKFVEFQLPKEAQGNEYRLFMDVGVLEGNLTLLEHVNGRREVWVMRNYGVEESWTKSHVITHYTITDLYCSVRLIRSFENGEILLVMGQNLVFYDSVRAIFGEFKSVSNMCEIENYVESLVSVNSGQYVNCKEDSEIQRNLLELA